MGKGKNLYKCPTCQYGPARWGVLLAHFQKSGHTRPLGLQGQTSCCVSNTGANVGQQRQGEKVKNAYRCPTCQAGPAKWGILVAHFRKSGHPKPPGQAGQASCRVNEPQDERQWTQDLKDADAEKKEWAAQRQQRKHDQRISRKEEWSAFSKQQVRMSEQTDKKSEMIDQMLASALLEKGGTSTVETLARCIQWGSSDANLQDLGTLEAYIKNRQHMFDIDSRRWVTMRISICSYDELSSACNNVQVGRAAADGQHTDGQIVEISDDETDENSSSCDESDSDNQEAAALPTPGTGVSSAVGQGKISCSSADLLFAPTPTAEDSRSHCKLKSDPSSQQFDRLLPLVNGSHPGKDPLLPQTSSREDQCASSAPESHGKQSDEFSSVGAPDSCELGTSNTRGQSKKALAPKSSWADESAKSAFNWAEWSEDVGEWEEEEKVGEDVAWSEEKSKVTSWSKWTEDKTKGREVGKWSDEKSKNISDAAWSEDKHKGKCDGQWVEDKSKSRADGAWSEDKTKGKDDGKWFEEKSKSRADGAWSEDKKRSRGDSSKWPEEKSRGRADQAWPEEKSKSRNDTWTEDKSRSRGDGGWADDESRGRGEASWKEGKGKGRGDASWADDRGKGRSDSSWQEDRSKGRGDGGWSEDRGKVRAEASWADDKSRGRGEGSWTDDKGESRGHQEWDRGKGKDANGWSSSKWGNSERQEWTQEQADTLGSSYTDGNAAKLETVGSHKRKHEDKQSLREAGLRRWLFSLDNGAGALLQYADAIIAEFDGDLVQVCAAWQGMSKSKSLLDSVDPEFFNAIGVKRAGHRFLFAQGMSKAGSKFNDL